MLNLRGFPVFFLLMAVGLGQAALAASPACVAATEKLLKARQADAMIELLNMAIDASNGRMRHEALSYAAKAKELVLEGGGDAYLLDHATGLIRSTRPGFERAFGKNGLGPLISMGLIHYQFEGGNLRLSPAKKRMLADLVSRLQKFADELDSSEALEREMREAGNERLATALNLLNAGASERHDMSAVLPALETEVSRVLRGSDEALKERVKEALALVRHSHEDIKKLSYDDLIEMAAGDELKAIGIVERYGDRVPLADAELPAAQVRKIKAGARQAAVAERELWDEGILDGSEVRLRGAVRVSEIEAWYWKGDLFGYLVSVSAKATEGSSEGSVHSKVFMTPEFDPFTELVGKWTPQFD
jgi:hypothetical protein